MIARSSGSFKDSMLLVFEKSANIWIFLELKMLNLNFETQVFMELVNN